MQLNLTSDQPVSIVLVNAPAVLDDAINTPIFEAAGANQGKVDVVCTVNGVEVPLIEALMVSLESYDDAMERRIEDRALELLSARGLRKLVEDINFRDSEIYWAYRKAGVELVYQAGKPRVGLGRLGISATEMSLPKPIPTLEQRAQDMVSAIIVQMKAYQERALPGERTTGMQFANHATLDGTVEEVEAMLALIKPVFEAQGFTFKTFWRPTESSVRQRPIINIGWGPRIDVSAAE